MMAFPCFGLFLILFGLGLGALGLFNLMQTRQLRALKIHQWPSVEGKIISTQVHEHQGGSGFMITVDYSVELGYEYVVNQVTYSPKIVLSNRQFHGHTVEEVAASVETCYAVGDPLTVYYNPDNPKVNVLETNRIESDHTLLMWGFVCTGVGLSLLCLGGGAL